jgi:hypothetical protein
MLKLNLILALTMALLAPAKATTDYQDYFHQCLGSLAEAHMNAATVMNDAADHLEKGMKPGDVAEYLRYIAKTELYHVHALHGEKPEYPKKPWEDAK